MIPLHLYFALDTLLNSSFLFVLGCLFVDLVKVSISNKYLPLCFLIEEKIKEYYLRTISFFYIDWNNSNYMFYGDYVIPEKCMFVANHSGSCEQGIFLNIVYNFGINSNFSVILKSQIGKIPGLGYLVSKFNPIYVRNGKDVDLGNISKQTSKLKNSKTHAVLIFPEGTYISDSDFGRDIVSRNKLLFDKYNKKEFEYVLFPRSNGLIEISNNLFNPEDKKVIYDFTICSQDHKSNISSPSPLLSKSFFDRKTKNKVHIMIKKRELDHVPTHEEILEWWEEKNSNIKYFHEHGKFNEDIISVLGNNSIINKQAKIGLLVLVNILHYMTVDYLIGTYIYVYLIMKIILIKFLS